MTRFTLALLLCAAACPVPAQAPTEVTRDLAGRVQGTGGQRARITIWHNDMRGASVEALCEGFTEDDGSFAFRKVPWIEGFDWGFNTMIAVARTKEKVGVLTIRGDAAPLDRLHLELGPTITLRGRVSAAGDTKPIAGARVWPWIFGRVDADHRPEIWVTAPLLPWHATTDAEGRFTIEGMPKIAPLQIRAAHEDFAESRVTIADPTAPCTIDLVRGGKISGKVTMPDGKPAVRVRVQASGLAAGSARTVTDDQGRFELTSLVEGTFKVWAEAPDLTVIALADLVIEPGTHVRNQHIQLVRGGFIVGRIVDAATGKPLAPGPGTDVAMYGPARPRGGACEATPVLPDGTFRIRAPAGSNYIYLRGSPGWHEPSATVEVRDGEEIAVEWRVTVHKKQ